MSHFKTYLLVACIAAALAALGPWLDGQPTDTDIDRATAADLRDAVAQAGRQERMERAEAAMRAAAEPEERPRYVGDDAAVLVATRR